MPRRPQNFCGASAVVVAGVVWLAASSLMAATTADAGAAAPTPTFTKHLAPILFKNCVECHRQSSMAPMSLMTFEDVRPWARAIKQQVTRREMPPWGADPTYGPYANDMSLTQAEIDTIAAWVDGGTPQGNAADLSPAPRFADGWSIGEPDLVFTMLEPITVPADGTMPYLYVTIPTNLKEEIWIRGVELKPTDRRVVHHIIGDLYEGNGQAPDPKPRLTRDRSKKEIGGIGGLVPGRLYGLFEDGVAKKIPAGAEIVLQMHYTTIGQPIVDRTQVGFVLAKEPPARLRAQGGGVIAPMGFVIPPGDPNYEIVGKKTFDQDTYLSSMYPHMHVRGKDATYTVVYPDGREEILLRVAKYDFNWQLNYKLKEPKFLPKGSTLVVTAHFDNSRGNRFNPDPAAEVRWGEQTWEEMMMGYYGTIEAPAATTTSSRQQE